MIKYEKLYEDVKSSLSEKRFKHSEGVVKRALEYAEIYKLNTEVVKLVAMAHDIAKELSEEEISNYIKLYNIEFDDIEKNSPNLWHTKIGAYICKDKYGFSDDMVNSVMYHTTGRANMSLLEKVIYLADATDETRAYGDMDYYVDIIKKDIDLGMVEVSKWVINHLLSKNAIIHYDSLKCYNYYANKIAK